MNYIIVDLEATCWQKGTSPQRMEIIEIGAVKLNEDFEIIDEFDSFVKPVVEPELSEFCIELTSIQQTDVDTAPTFLEIYPEFLKWIGADEYYLCSWGAYDPKQFMIDCERNVIPYPEKFSNHINIKKEFCTWQEIRPCGMKRALQILDIPLEGSHHRGIDDARNIAKIAKVIFPKILNERKITCYI